MHPQQTRAGPSRAGLLRTAVCLAWPGRSLTGNPWCLLSFLLCCREERPDYTRLVLPPLSRAGLGCFCVSFTGWGGLFTHIHSAILHILLARHYGLRPRRSGACFVISATGEAPSNFLKLNSARFCMQEILEFCRRVAPDAEEDAERSAAHGAMQAACAAVKLFNVQPFGSRASGLELWESDIDLVVLGVVKPSGDNHSEHKLLTCFYWQLSNPVLTITVHDVEDSSTFAASSPSVRLVVQEAHWLQPMAAVCLCSLL